MWACSYAGDPQARHEVVEYIPFGERRGHLGSVLLVPTAPVLETLDRYEAAPFFVLQVA